MLETTASESRPAPPTPWGRDATDQAWPVAVFAHNEEANIIGALESVARGSENHPIQAYVIANGCSDRTEAVVRDFAEAHPWLTPVSIPLGDKANAWNVFVHELAPGAEVYFFVDGDVQVCPGSFDALFSALRATPGANIAAAIPVTGRHRKLLEMMACEQHLVLGNLYALRGEFVGRVRSAGVRVPVGYIYEDGLLTSLGKWDLDTTGPFLHERVVPCPAAGFAYRSFSPRRPRDWRMYWRRRVRYSQGYFQHELLVPILRRAGIRGMPITVEELYQQQSEMLKYCRPRVDTNTLFDMIALRRMLVCAQRQTGRGPAE